MMLRSSIAAPVARILGESGKAQPRSSKSNNIIFHAWVTDFMSPSQFARFSNGEVIDCTDAFYKAQEAAVTVWIAPGSYGLSGLRLLDGRSLVGVSENSVHLHQMTPDKPVIDCRSDEHTGQLSGIHVSGVTLRGHPNATAALFMVAAYQHYAVWRCSFQYVARNSFRALEIQGADAANVFYSRFDVTSEGTQDTAALVNGGTYNSFRLFLTKCSSLAMDDSSANAYIRAITENCMIFRGQNNRIWPTIEELPTGAAAKVGIEDRGYGNTFENPTVIVSTEGVLDYAFKPFSNSIFVNPQIIGKQAAVLHPFDRGIGEGFTVIGGRSQAKNVVEKTYDNSSKENLFESITFIGESTGIKSAVKSD